MRREHRVKKLSKSKEKTLLSSLLNEVNNSKTALNDLAVQIKDKKNLIKEITVKQEQAQEKTVDILKKKEDLSRGLKDMQEKEVSLFKTKQNLEEEISNLQEKTRGLKEVAQVIVIENNKERALFVEEKIRISKEISGQQAKAEKELEALNKALAEKVSKLAHNEAVIIKLTEKIKVLEGNIKLSQEDYNKMASKKTEMLNELKTIDQDTFEAKKRKAEVEKDFKAVNEKLSKVQTVLKETQAEVDTKKKEIIAVIERERLINEKASKLERLYKESGLKLNI
jgi:chromosome segregation ATPase